MKLVSSFLLLFLVGCSLFYPKNDNHLLEYSEAFVKESEGKVSVKDVKKVQIYFKTQDDAVGTCNYMTDVIEIDPTFFYTATAKPRKTVIYHELGHCVCKRDHTMGQLNDACPDSIMYYKVVNRKCLDKHWDYYMKEIYTGCKK